MQNEQLVKINLKKLKSEQESGLKKKIKATGLSSKKIRVTCFSVKLEVHAVYMSYLNDINNAAPEYKEALKKVTINDLLECMQSQLTDKLKNKLLLNRLTGVGKQKLLKNRYQTIHGDISEDEWANFMLDPEFQKFKKENSDCLDLNKLNQ